MDPINDNKIPEPFPYEALTQARNLISPDKQRSSDYSAQSYDNRGRISDTAKALRARLGYFQARVSKNSFLSEAFTWQVKTAKSSEPLKLLAEASSQALEKWYSLEIDSLAAARTASSNHLLSNEISEFESGTYSYSLTVGSAVYDVSFGIDNPAYDPVTNRSVLKTLERSINNLGAGVTAEVVDIQKKDYNPYREDTFKDLSYLNITSDATGDDTSFSLADTNATVIETLNLDRIVRFGRENDYRLGGSPKTLDSNEVTVEAGTVEGRLLGTTAEGENVRIHVKKSLAALADELTGVIQDYNELIEWINDTDYAISPSLKQALFENIPSQAVESKTVKRTPLTEQEAETVSPMGFETELNLNQTAGLDQAFLEIGLTLNPGGMIDISDDFATSVTSDLLAVYNALAGETGFFSTLSENIDAIEENREVSYVYAFNSTLSYDPDSSSRQSIYRSSTPAIINFFV